MRRFLKSLNRILLAVGLLAALTPCGLCRAAGMPACGMKMSDCGKDCCHSKRAPVACKAMDRSALPAAAFQMKAPAAAVVAWRAPLQARRLPALSPGRDLPGSPPSRAPLSLRI